MGGIWAWHGGNYGGYDALEVIGKHACDISRVTRARSDWRAQRLSEHHHCVLRDNNREQSRMHKRSAPDHRAWGGDV